MHEITWKGKRRTVEARRFGNGRICLVLMPGEHTRAQQFAPAGCRALPLRGQPQPPPDQQPPGRHPTRHRQDEQQRAEPGDRGIG